MIGSQPELRDAVYPSFSPQSGVSTVTRAMATVRRELATQWIGMSPADVQRHYAEQLGHIHRLVYGSGLREGPRSDDDLTFIATLKASLSDEGLRKNNPGMLLAAMLFLSPHEFPHLYELDAIPSWLLRDYLIYTLIGPTIFRQIGEAEVYCDYASRWTGYLHEKVLANSKSEFWRNIGLIFTQSARFTPLYFNTRNLRDLYRKRAAIMEATLVSLKSEVDYVFAPRPKRNRLRLGILADHYAPLTETYATLPVYHYVDRTKFEVQLFSLQQTNTLLEQFCARHAERFAVLPPALPQRLQMLRAADLDLILIATNATAGTNDITVLALHRLARVQVANVCSCVTTGMRNVDYYLSGRFSETTDAQSHYTEKLIMVDGPAHCFDFGNDLPSLPTETMKREILGVAADAIVFVSGAIYFKILPELEDAWMRILSAIPRSRLVLYPFNPNWGGGYPVDAFLERLNSAMTRYGLDSCRLIVLRVAPNKADVLQRLRIGNIYLDSFPFAGVTSLLDPLQVGLPPVVMDGDPFRARVGAALLRDLELDELIVKDVNSYVALAVRLASEDSFRNRIHAHILSKIKGVPKFLNSRWYGEQAGFMFDHMWKDSGHGR